MSHGTRATLFAALLGLALSGPAGSFRLMEGIQAWMGSLWADTGSAQIDEGSIMDPDGCYGETRALYRDFAEPWVQNRRRWVRARILRGVGKVELAESLFLTVRDGFLAEGIPYDTALVSLELAALYAEHGRTAELKRLAGEMLPIFTSLQIHREAMAALSFLQQAMESERAGLGLVTAVADYLRRAQHRPELRFEAPE